MGRLHERRWPSTFASSPVTAQSSSCNNLSNACQRAHQVAMVYFMYYIWTGEGYWYDAYEEQYEVAQECWGSWTLLCGGI